MLKEGRADLRNLEDMESLVRGEEEGIYVRCGHWNKARGSSNGKKTQEQAGLRLVR